MRYQEWSDALFLFYGIDPPYLPPHCKDCNASFSILHALYCKKGGLIRAHRNELRDGVFGLSGKAFTLLYMGKTFLIHPGSKFQEGEAQKMGSFTPIHPELKRHQIRRDI